MKIRQSQILTCTIVVLVLGTLAWSVHLVATAAEPGRANGQGLEQHKRVQELAQSKGISTADALATLRKEAETKGPELYEKNCAECHHYTDPKGKVYGVDASSGSDLTGLGSAQWIAGWFDKKKIASPAYFGNTAFKDGDMVEFVRGSLGEILEELAEDDDVYKTAHGDLVACLAAEAKLDGPRKADADT
jgi:mono/diheme cytochrome c family protein